VTHAIYLRSILWNENHRCFNKGESIGFKPVTLLVGDQGCGKSTLLYELHTGGKHLTSDCPTPVETRYFDTEKNNPRIAASLDDTPLPAMATLQLRWCSHGQAMLKMAKAMEAFKRSMILWDEPESGLSVRSQYALLDVIKTALKNRNQLVIATHSIPLIESQRCVYSMEHRAWMRNDEFLETQKQHGK
jgi:predicted ATPase